MKRGKIPLKEIASTHNVGLSTLRRWINSYKQGDVPLDSKRNNVSSPMTPAQKLHHISVCHALKDDALGAYCRQHGFYSHELLQWKSDFLKALVPPDVTKKQEKTDLSVWRKKCADLECDVKRKDKALAKASALLIFLKKSPSDLGGKRGRMIKEDDRQRAVQLIKEHSAAGLPKQPFCAHLGISYRTFQRWSKSSGIKDRRYNGPHKQTTFLNHPILGGKLKTKKGENYGCKEKLYS